MTELSGLLGAVVRRRRRRGRGAASDVPSADAPGALALGVVVGPGLDGGSGGESLGTGRPHHRPMGQGFRRRRSRGAGV